MDRPVLHRCRGPGPGVTVRLLLPGVEQFGFDTKMTHVSTGGGAFLAYVEGKPFQSLAQIDDK